MSLQLIISWTISWILWTCHAGSGCSLACVCSTNRRAMHANSWQKIVQSQPLWTSNNLWQVSTNSSWGISVRKSSIECSTLLRSACKDRYVKRRLHAFDQLWLIEMVGPIFSTWWNQPLGTNKVSPSLWYNTILSALLKLGNCFVSTWRIS